MKLKSILDRLLEDVSRMEEIDIGLDDIDIPEENHNTKIMKFSIDNLIYQCNFDKFISKDGKSILEFNFQLLNSPNRPSMENFSDYRQYLIVLSKSQVDISGTGNPLLVFKYILAYLRDYLKKEQIDFITFIGDEDHTKVYKNSNHYFKKYLGYSQLEKNPINGESLLDGEFWFGKM